MGYEYKSAIVGKTHYIDILLSKIYDTLSFEIRYFHDRKGHLDDL